MLSFQAMPPPVDLKDLIGLYWSLESAHTGLPGPPIVPDGCCELIVHLGAPLRRLGSDEARQPRAFLFGQIARAIRLEDTGPSEVFAVRFTPSGAAHWLRQDMDELDAREYPLDDLLGASRRLPLGALVDAADFAARCRVMDTWFRRWRPALLPAGAAIARSVVDRLRIEAATVGTLVRELGVGRRRLERIFTRTVGLPIAQFGRIVRIERAAREVAESRRSLVDIALDAGFADHAHFSRRFGEVVGMTPSRYRQEMAIMRGHSDF